MDFQKFQRQLLTKIVNDSKNCFKTIEDKKE